mmetsp:Transcript_12398/g.20100  ORF Transcript_12398/g.20100 Transcript_12398/m.20100 type:complete len:215 (+) Transcript_12398:118-762(+)
MEERLVYSLGGALILVYNGEALRHLETRKYDGALGVKVENVKKNLMVQGKSLRIKRDDGSIEPQYRWNCPKYTSCPVAYKTSEYVFLFPDMVFESAKQALTCVIESSPKLRLPNCLTVQGENTLHLGIEPLFQESGRRLVYSAQADTLGVCVDCDKETNEDKRNTLVLETIADQLGLGLDTLQLEWDQRKGVVVVIKNADPIALHSTLERKYLK